MPTKKYYMLIRLGCLMYLTLLSSILTANTTLSTEQRDAMLTVVTNYILADSNPILEVTQPNQALSVDLNMVKTIKCDALTTGDTFTINGILYTVVNNTTLTSIDKNSGDFEHICTSKVTDIGSLFFLVSTFNLFGYNSPTLGSSPCDIMC